MVPVNTHTCLTCSEARRCRDSAWSWAFFAIGLIATFSVRLVIVFMNFSVLYAKIAWYVGVIGFFVFFLYKFNVEHGRSRLIARNGLVRKVNAQEPLTERDYALMGALLCGLSSNRDRINYFVIFSTSIITVLLALYEDFFR